MGRIYVSPVRYKVHEFSIYHWSMQKIHVDDRNMLFQIFVDILKVPRPKIIENIKTCLMPVVWYHMCSHWNRGSRVPANIPHLAHFHVNKKPFIFGLSNHLTQSDMEDYLKYSRLHWVTIKWYKYVIKADKKWERLYSGHTEILHPQGAGDWPKYKHTPQD